VSALSLLFLILVAITVSIAVQFVGVLLIFTLLVGPVATAMRLFRRPLWVILTAMLLGLLFIWGGILLAANGDWPVSCYITALSFGIYLPVRLLSPRWIRKRSQPPVQAAIVHPGGNQEPVVLTGSGNREPRDYQREHAQNKENVDANVVFYS
jgi:zinc/manganese transport system permease protein